MNNKPDFESDTSFSGAIAFLTIGCVFTTLFSIYLIICILRIRPRPIAGPIKQILYLTLIDSVFGILLIARTLFAVYTPAEQTYEICAAWSYIFVSTQSVSYAHVLTICIHRYRMVRNLNLPSLTTGRYRHDIESAVIWMTIFLVFLVPFIVWGRPGEILTSCRIDYMFATHEKDPVVYLLFLFCTPWISTNTLYIIITKKLCSRSPISSLNKVHPSTSTATDTGVSGTQLQQKETLAVRSARDVTINRNKQIMRTISILLVLFNISILSYIIILSLTLISKDIIVPAPVYVLGLVNNIGNPFVYASTVSTLRQEMKRLMITLYKSCRNSQSASQQAAQNGH